MMICQVVGHVWATKKEEKLNGHKLMIVREETTTTRKGATFVAADSVGAGIGEMVLVVSGSTARRAIGEDHRFHGDFKGEELTWQDLRKS